MQLLNLMSKVKLPNLEKSTNTTWLTGASAAETISGKDDDLFSGLGDPDEDMSDVDRQAWNAESELNCYLNSIILTGKRHLL